MMFLNFGGSFPKNAGGTNSRTKMVGLGSSGAVDGKTICPPEKPAHPVVNGGSDPWSGARAIHML